MKKYIVFVCAVVILFSYNASDVEARLTAQCFVSPSTNVVPGEEVRWKVEPQGGEAVYRFEWSGSEGLQGSENEASIIYRTPGLKRASVLVLSGTEQYRTECSQVPVSYTPLRGACYVQTKLSQSAVISTYTADIMGGSGAYTYAWSGTDGLTGSSQKVSHSYTTPGFKVATVIVSSESENLKLTCNTEVPEVHRLPSKEVLFGCQADTDSFASDEPFRWESIYSAPSTNRGSREVREDTSFRWIGTEDVRESGEDISLEYERSGYKSVEHRVYDEHTGLRAEHVCQAYIVNSRNISDREESRRTIDRDRDYENGVIRSGVHFNTSFNSCLIAGVAQGTEWESKEVDIRAFRDTYMSSNKIGQFIEAIYDTVSPGYALLLEQSDLLRMHTRTFLTPIVSLIKPLI